MSAFAGSLKRDEDAPSGTERFRPAAVLLVLLAVSVALDFALFLAAPLFSPDWLGPAAIAFAVAAALAAASAVHLALRAAEPADKRRSLVAASIAGVALAAGLLGARTDAVTLVSPTSAAAVVFALGLLAGALWALAPRARGRTAALGIVGMTDALLPAGVLTFAGVLIASHAVPVPAPVSGWFVHAIALFCASVIAAAAWFDLATHPDAGVAWGRATGATGLVLAAGLWLVGWSGYRPELVVAAYLLIAVAFACDAAGGLIDVLSSDGRTDKGIANPSLPRTVIMHWLPMLLVGMTIMAVVAMRTLNMPATVLPIVVLFTALVYAARLIASLVSHEFALDESLRRQMALLRRANIDALTDLPNRAALDQRLSEEYERARRFSQPFAICFIDVDHFKQVNDTYGHDRGDVVLRLVARSLRQTARTIDIVGRYGGEEFLVLAPGTRSADAVILAERLRTTVEDVTASGDFGAVPVTISVGIAGYPDNGLTLEDVLRDADLALYDAKRSGRNRVRMTDRTPTDNR